MMDLKFYIPAEIELIKSSTEDGERRIRGYASTSNVDRQNEEVLQKGLDISEFADYGWLNYNHDNTKIIGYPDKEKTKITSKGFYVEGTLLKGVTLAEEVWELAKSLKDESVPRKLGFSIEGKVLQKTTEGKILKAKVYNVAITPNPVNPHATWDILSKSFTKGMEAGYGTKVGEINNGSSLKAESLESAFFVISEAIKDNKNAIEILAQLKNKLMNKSLNQTEAISYLQIFKGMSKDDTLNIIRKLYTEV